jgi:hypothetical protein
MNETSPLFTSKTTTSSSKKNINNNNNSDDDDDKVFKEKVYVCTTPEQVKKYILQPTNNVRPHNVIVRLNNTTPKLIRSSSSPSLLNKQKLQFSSPPKGGGGGDGTPVNIDEAVKAKTPPYHQNHIYQTNKKVLLATSKQTAKYNGVARYSIQKSMANNEQQQQQQQEQQHQQKSSNNDDEPNKHYSLSQLQQMFFASLQITEPVKRIVNEKLIKGTRQLQSRIAVWEFYRTSFGVCNVSSYQDMVSKYAYVNTLNEPKEISENQLSIDLLKHEEQFKLISSILNHLKSLQKRPKYMISKQELLIGLKSITQITLPLSPTSSNLIKNTEEEEEGEETGLFDEFLDCMSEISPIKVTLNAHYYQIIVDYASTISFMMQQQASSSLGYSNK